MPCTKNHDPQPWVQYTMQTGQAGGWAGAWKFRPRSEYCQNERCYNADNRARDQREG